MISDRVWRMERSGRGGWAMLEKLMPRKRDGTGVPCRRNSQHDGVLSDSPAQTRSELAAGPWEEKDWPSPTGRTLQLRKTTAVPG